MFRIADAFFKGDVLEGEVGIEIELEGEDLPPSVGNGKVWTVTRDGSLRDEAFEYIFTKPVERKAVSSSLDILYGALKSSKSTLHDTGRAGVHVHVNIRDLSPRQLYNFALLYLVFEKNLVDFCGEDRVGNLFCLRALDAEFLMVTLRKLLRTHEFSLTKSDNLRYASMNLTSILKYGSLEFRAMASPVPQETIENWVKLLLRLKDFAKELESPATVVLGVSELGGADFARDVFKEDLPLLKSEDWRKDVIHGMRLIQPLANTFDSEALDKWEANFREKAEKLARLQEAEQAIRETAANGAFIRIPLASDRYDALSAYLSPVVNNLNSRIVGSFYEI
jgi:hypothetical protein